MNKVANILAAVFERPQIWLSSKEKDDRSIFDLVEALLGTSGEISGAMLAFKIFDRYSDMDDVSKEEFFQYLATDLDVQPDVIRTALKTYETEPTKANYKAFMTAAEPRRQELVRRLNQVPTATGKLVEMRKDLLQLAHKDPRLSAVDLDFRHLLSSWFNRGFLVLRPINWQSPAVILEKIIQYEAVHEITSWDDLRGRLQPEDRRCFAFFHPAMPDEPLIFVEVALSKGIPNSIQSVLNKDRISGNPIEADTAVFYSISNCQAGLAGISFGNSLIKQVVNDLSRELPNLNTFSTLSPIPGFSKWFTKTNRDASALPVEDTHKLAAHYILTAKRSDGWPMDAVTRFHLGNGAEVHEVHSQADRSEKGMSESFGMMVSYLYDLPKISSNHEGFVTDKKITASPQVEYLNRTATKAEL
jgi:malonyl-CoA decarboxylase